METILKWMPVIMFLTNILFLWVAWSIRQVAAEGVADLRREFGLHENRLIRLEATVEAMPSARDVSRLREDIARFTGEVSTLEQALKGVSDTTQTLRNGIDFLTQYMVEHGAR